MSLNTPQSQQAGPQQAQTKAPEIKDTFTDYLGFLQEGMPAPRKRVTIDVSTSIDVLRQHANDPDIILDMTNATQVQKDSLTHVAGSISDGITTNTKFPHVVYANLQYIGGSLDITAAGSLSLPKLKICGNDIKTLLIKGYVDAPELEFVRGKLNAGNGDTIAYPKLKAAGCIVAKADEDILLPSLVVAGELFLFCKDMNICSLAQTGLGSSDAEEKAKEIRDRNGNFNNYQGTVRIVGPKYIQAVNLEVSYSKIVVRDVYQANFNRLRGLTEIYDETNTQNEGSQALTIAYLPSLEWLSGSMQLPNVVRLELPQLTSGGRGIYAPSAKSFRAPLLETVSGVGHIESPMQYPAHLTLNNCEIFEAPKLKTNVFSTAEIKLPSSCLMDINPALLELQKCHLQANNPGGRLSTIHIVGEHNKQPETNPNGLKTAQYYYDLQQKLLPTLPKPKGK